jgi:hypothetical protein
VSCERWRRICKHAHLWVFAVGIVSACGRGGSHDAQEVASLRLACAPASRGLRCQLLALSRDVSRPPRDVTAEASWRLSGIKGTRISVDGVIDAPADGDVEIDAQYAAHGVQARARLARDHPGQMLAVLRGQVYAENNRALRTVARVRVEVVGGPNAGLATTTLEDGSYELTGVVAGDIVIRATRIGYTSAEGSTQLHPGDNRLSLVMEVEPPSTSSAL